MTLCRVHTVPSENFDVRIDRPEYRPATTAPHRHKRKTHCSAARLMMMMVLTAGFESIPQETFTVCLMAALITVDSAKHTGGSASMQAGGVKIRGALVVDMVVDVCTLFAPRYRNLCKRGGRAYQPKNNTRRGWFGKRKQKGHI